MRRRIHGAGPLPLGLAVSLTLAAPSAYLPGQTLTDISGRTIGTPAQTPAEGGAAAKPGAIRSMPAGELTDGGRVVRYPAGHYMVDGTTGPPEDLRPAAVSLFRDGTLEYFPLREWDLGDVETGDVSGDGLPDIVFSIKRSDCDSIQGTRPRIWIQNELHRFTDETLARVPAVSTSTFDVDLFDADADGDLDILLGGYSCLNRVSYGSLLMNDGAGVFTDESAARLLAVPENHVIYFAEPALIDADAHPDIVAILIDLNSPANLSYYPYLFLNTGDGHFWPDHNGRLLDYGDYGFFNVEAADLTGDGLEDLLFLNVADLGEGLDGRLALFRNAGNGFMVDETAARMDGDSVRRTRDVAIADVDNDGDPDVLDVGFFSGLNVPQIVLQRNNGAGVYTRDTGGGLSALSAWYNDAELAPFNGDTLPDLFLTRVRVGGVDSDLLLLNGGDGSFRDSSELLPPVIDFSVAAAVSDYDGDGDMDIVVGNSNPTINGAGQNRLYINQRYSPPADVPPAGRLPRGTALLQNYPNPFNASTVIRYSLATGASVTIEAVNVLGTVVLRAERPYRPPGTYEFTWDAGGLPGGVYFYSVLAGGTRMPQRAAVLLK